MPGEKLSGRGMFWGTDCSGGMSWEGRSEAKMLAELPGGMNTETLRVTRYLHRIKC